MSGFQIKIPESQGGWETGVPNPDYFVGQNSGTGGGKVLPPGVGDEGDNIVSDTNYMYHTGGGGFGASANQGGMYKSHSRDDGTSLYGNGGNDVLFGYGGNDTLHGGTGNDILFGGTGDDMMLGEQGADIMFGESGNDVYVVDDAGDKVVEDAAANSGNADKVYTTLSSYTLTDNVEILQYTGPGNFTGHGNALDNILVGGNGNDKLYGEAGNDLLLGGNGADTLEGGGGNDTLNGEGGADAMYGGAGNDVYIVDNVNDTVFENGSQIIKDPSSGLMMTGNGGTDKIYTTLDSYDLSAPGKGANIEELQFIGTGDFKGNGNGLANWIIGGEGNDTLSGAGGNDSVAGGLGNDKLYGDEGNDLLLGEAGSDQLFGGTGNDTLTGGQGYDTFMFADHGGQDTITDFTHGQDKINLGGVSAVHSFQDLKLTDVDGGVLVEFGDTSVLVQGQTKASMTEADFSFGPTEALPPVQIPPKMLDPFGPFIDYVNPAKSLVLEAPLVSNDFASLDALSTPQYAVSDMVGQSKLASAMAFEGSDLSGIETMVLMDFGASAASLLAENASQSYLLG